VDLVLVPQFTLAFEEAAMWIAIGIALWWLGSLLSYMYLAEEEKDTKAVFSSLLWPISAPAALIGLSIIRIGDWVRRCSKKEEP